MERVREGLSTSGGGSQAWYSGMMNLMKTRSGASRALRCRRMAAVERCCSRGSAAMVACTAVVQSPIQHRSPSWLWRSIEIEEMQSKIWRAIGLVRSVVLARCSSSSSCWRSESWEV